MDMSALLISTTTSITTVAAAAPTCVDKKRKESAVVPQALLNPSTDADKTKDSKAAPRKKARATLSMDKAASTAVTFR